VLLAGLWACFLRHAAPSVTVGDSGEFITAAATLSLPHSPGYPLFALIGKLFSSLFPWANAGYRLNISSAALNLVSVGLVFFIATRRGGLSWRGGAFCGLLLAGSPAFFLNGLVTEVFALNTALALAVAALFLAGGPRAVVGGAFLFGLGLGNHHTLLLTAPALFLFCFSSSSGSPERGEERLRRVGRLLLPMGLFALLGFSVYAFLPLRSRAQPPLDWGNPETLNGLLRTVSRKDYGSFSLALGETPPRTLATAAKQMRRFGKVSVRQLSPWGAVAAVLGFFLLWRSVRWTALGLFAAWFFTGPFFMWLGNLPFDAQSDGIMDRFYILPTVFGVLAAGGFWKFAEARLKRWAWPLLAFPLFQLWSVGREFPLRGDFLVQDYSQNILRTLPPGAVFFMDGGDDTFYSMAYQRFVRRQRDDLAVFDRGGLIFSSAYGPDFRSLPREAKDRRRQDVERNWLTRRPLYYSTMNDRLLPGVPLGLTGFLYRAGASDGNAGLCDLYAFRSLYPPPSQDYRTLALAPYFPFMASRASFQERQYARAATLMERTRRMGGRVPWLQENLMGQCLEFGYDRLQAGDFEAAGLFYDVALRMKQPKSELYSNLGVLWERRGNPAEAVRSYENALRLSPDNVDALYNLAVVFWRRSDWARVVPLLERVIALNPQHPGGRYLAAARERRAGRHDGR